MRRLAMVIAAVVLGTTAPSAHAATKLGQAVVLRCDQGVATFEGRLTPLKRATKAQLRFTLQARTPDDPDWRAVQAPGFGSWITAPKVGRYLYDKTVEELPAPGDYRAVVQFRWRDARGHTLRSERAVSKACVQPDLRPDLVVKSLKLGPTYVALVANEGRGEAGSFTVAFLHNGAPLGSVEVPGLAAGQRTTVALDAPACVVGELITAQADSLDTVDEADEDANTLNVTC